MRAHLCICSGTERYTYPDAAFSRELNDVLVVSLLFEFTERPDPASFDDVM